MADHAGHSHGSGGCGHAHDGPASGAADDTCADGPVVERPHGADLPLLRPSTRPAETLAAEFLRAEALYHHINDGTLIPECEGPSSAAAAAGEEAHSVSGTAGSAADSRLPHDNNRHTQDALTAFLRCADMIRREAVFSRNEELADVPTGSIQYLLCEFYIASLRQRAPVSAAAPGDLARPRLAQLKAAKSELEAFLAQCYGVRGLIDDAEAVAIGLLDIVPYLAELYGVERTPSGGAAGSRKAGSGEGEEDGDRDYSTNVVSSRAATALSARATAAAAGGGGRVDPGALRQQKIERFKRNTAASKRLRELAALNARAVDAARKRGMGDAEAAEAAQLDGIGASLGGPVLDDEARREMLLLTVQHAVRQSLDDLAGIAQELPLLQRMAAMAAAAPAGAAADAGGYAGAGGGGGGSLSADGRVSGRERSSAGAAGSGAAADGRAPDFSGRTGPPPGDISMDPTRKGLEVARIDPTYTITRETVKAGVFNNPFPGPTMEMEDWGDIVTAKRIEREAREKAQVEGRGRSLDEIISSGLEGEGCVGEDEFDEATARKRRMDDWKDGVPKGAGNTKRI